MDKIEETREFLHCIGMPKAQQADICCYVILAMAGIKPDMQWKEATNEWIRIHDIIQFAILIMELHMPRIAGRRSENRHYIIFGQQHW